MQSARLQNAATRPKISDIALRMLLILFGLLVAVSAVFIVYSAFASGNTDPQMFIIPVVTLIPFILGWLIDRKHPGHRIALLFLIMAYSSALSIIVEAIRRVHEARGTEWLSPGAESIVRVLGHSLYIPGVFVPLFLMPLFFPTGRLLSSRWRPVVALIVMTIAWMFIATALRPWPWPEYGIPDTRPLNGIPGSEAFFDAALVVQSAVTVPVFLLAILSGFIRFRRAEGMEREQMKWPILALLVFAVLVAVRLLIPELETLEVSWGYPLTWTMAMLFPISIGIAILRQRLWDIDVAISRTLIYGVLSAMVVALYIAIVGLLSVLFQTQTNIYSGLAAAAVIAVLFQPLREHLQHQVNRLVYGERDDPAAVLTRLAEGVQTAETPDSILPSLAETIAQTLKLPHVAIYLTGEQGHTHPGAVWGEARGMMQTIPLTYQRQTIGNLLVASRGADQSFSQQELELLKTIGTLAATTVHAVQLSDELRRSRQRIITAREDERRRLRRDLHDGLGPQLASQTLGLEAVSQLMPADPQKALAILDSLKHQAEEATREVRRLVYDLRPPALDNLGLVDALRQRAARYETGELRFRFDMPEEPLDLPAAVETAVYRIGLEAMTNVLRHSAATRCTVRLWLQEGQVNLEVRDNGRGLSPDQRPGVGLQAMKERAAELNGQLSLQSPPGGGTQVRLILPLQEQNG